VQKKTVLYCAPIDQPGNSGRYIMKGIEQAGLSVIGYDYRTNQNHEEDIFRILKGENPFYFFTQKGETLSPELINKIKDFGCVTIFWCLDVPISDWYVPVAKSHDFVLTNVEDHVDYLRKQGIRNVKWMHQGFAPEFFGIEFPGIELTSNYYADVAMIGSMGKAMEGLTYNKRCELVMRMLRENIDVKWWGHRLSIQLRNIRYFFGGVNRVWAGKDAYMKDFADVIRHTKIVLGEDADKPLTGRYLSNRSFAVMGCGGFYLCRRTPGVEYAFEIGKEVEVFDTDDEMIEKINFYLKNEEKRKQIALAGQKKVLDSYTYGQQMKKIFAWVNENIQE
jgi:spore maturation protein CgeB